MAEQEKEQGSAPVSAGAAEEKMVLRTENLVKKYGKRMYSGRISSLSIPEKKRKY